MKKYIAILALSMIGCSSISSVPSVVKVNIPVGVPCKTERIEPPKFAVDSLPIGSNIWDQMAALRADRVLRKAYEKQLQTAIDACN